MKNVLIISGSPRKKGNSQRLCEEFKKGAEDKGNSVELIRLAEKKIGFCKACDVCMKNNGTCVQKDDMAEVLESFKKADVLVLATPVYFYGICAQMKTFIDRTYPIWQHLGEKEVYYIKRTYLCNGCYGCRKSLRNALHKYSLSNGLPYISR